MTEPHEILISFSRLECFKFDNGIISKLARQNYNIETNKQTSKLKHSYKYCDSNLSLV